MNPNLPLLQRISTRELVAGYEAHKTIPTFEKRVIAEAYSMELQRRGEPLPGAPGTPYIVPLRP